MFTLGVKERKLKKKEKKDKQRIQTLTVQETGLLFASSVSLLATGHKRIQILLDILLCLANVEYI